MVLTIAIEMDGDRRRKRRRRGTAEAARDREWLRWIGRFRFVTARLLAPRFGVSEQQANARVRRLAAAGLVSRTAGGVGQAYAVALTSRGARSVGLPDGGRRGPMHSVTTSWPSWISSGGWSGGSSGRLWPGVDRARVPRATGAWVRPYSVSVFGRRSAREEQRWPDVVVEGPSRKAAFELEFSPKGAERLRSIPDAYACSSYADVCFLVTSPAVARAVARWTVGNGGGEQVSGLCPGSVRLMDVRRGRRRGDRVSRASPTSRDWRS